MICIEFVLFRSVIVIVTYAVLCEERKKRRRWIISMPLNRNPWVVYQSCKVCTNVTAIPQLSSSSEWHYMTAIAIVLRNDFLFILSFFWRRYFVRSSCLTEFTTVAGMSPTQAYYFVNSVTRYKCGQVPGLVCAASMPMRRARSHYVYITFALIIKKTRFYRVN